MTTPAPASPPKLNLSVKFRHGGERGCGCLEVARVGVDKTPTMIYLAPDSPFYLDFPEARLTFTSTLDAANTLPKVEAERDRLRAVLREVEWGTETVCPWCRGLEPRPDSNPLYVHGHAPDCALAAALKETP